jgi:diguanylate cyclase (GGDEF)-like protein
LQLATHNNFTDRMTGLPNDLAFETEGTMAVHLDHALNQPTQVAALDLDYFKKINDRLGHAAGDTALKALASVLTTAKGRLIRSSDLAARLHGEEFAVLLPNTTLAEAVEVMERVPNAVEKLRIPVTKAAGGTTDVISMTVSIGIATVTVTKDQPAHVALSEAMENADAATYDAKRAGRNQVRVYVPATAPDAGVDGASVFSTQLRA